MSEDELKKIWKAAGQNEDVNDPKGNPNFQNKMTWTLAEHYGITNDEAKRMIENAGMAKDWDTILKRAKPDKKTDPVPTPFTIFSYNAKYSEFDFPLKVLFIKTCMMIITYGLFRAGTQFPGENILSILCGDLVSL